MTPATAILKHLAKSGDVDTQTALFDDHMRPDPRKQLSLGGDHGDLIVTAAQ